MSLRLAGHRDDGTPIYEEVLRDGAYSVFAGDPRYCQRPEPHETHEHRYVYVRPEEHGGRTTGQVTCHGEGRADPPPPQNPVTIVYEEHMIEVYDRPPGWPT